MYRDIYFVGKYHCQHKLRNAMTKRSKIQNISVYYWSKHRVGELDPEM